MKIEKQPLAMHLSPRCGAKSKRTGMPCKAPAMSNGRCRMHGGKSPGAPTGNQNAYKHGCFTADAIKERRYLRALIKDSIELIKKINHL